MVMTPIQQLLLYQQPMGNEVLLIQQSAGTNPSLDSHCKVIPHKFETQGTDQIRYVGEDREELGNPEKLQKKNAFWVREEGKGQSKYRE